MPVVNSFYNEISEKNSHVSDSRLLGKGISTPPRSTVMFAPFSLTWKFANGHQFEFFPIKEKKNVGVHTLLHKDVRGLMCTVSVKCSWRPQTGVGAPRPEIAGSC